MIQKGDLPTHETYQIDDGIMDISIRKIIMDNKLQLNMYGALQNEMIIHFDPATVGANRTFDYHILQVACAGVGVVNTRRRRRCH